MPSAADVTADQIKLARLYVGDDRTATLLEDDAYRTLIWANNFSVMLAAADALENIAASELMVSKKIKSQDIATDAPAVAEQLRKLAAQLRARANAAGQGVPAEFFDVVGAPNVVYGQVCPELTDCGYWEGLP